MQVNEKINGKKMVMVGLLLLLLAAGVGFRWGIFSSANDGEDGNISGNIEFPILIAKGTLSFNDSGSEPTNWFNSWYFDPDDAEYNGTSISTYDGAAWCLIIQSSISSSVYLRTWVSSDPVYPMNRVVKDGIDVTKYFRREQNPTNKSGFNDVMFRLEPGETWNISGVVPNGTYKPPEPWWEGLFKFLIGQPDPMPIDPPGGVGVYFEVNLPPMENLTKQAKVKLQAYLLREGIQPYEKASGLEIIATIPAVAFLALIVVKRRSKHARHPAEK